MGEEELDDYESTLELALVQEYKAVVGMFDFAVETDRRFYLANDVAIEVRSAGTPTLLEVTLHDAWVWDMYRAARFVPSVRILTFRDVNIETPAQRGPAALGMELVRLVAPLSDRDALSRLRRASHDGLRRVATATP